MHISRFDGSAVRRISAAVTLSAVPLLSANAQDRQRKPEVMIVGVAHLVAKNDLHNATWGEDALSPHMQEQITTIVRRLAAFKPTRVMIEGEIGNPVFAQRYAAYLAGSYTLTANERDQFGFRLAAASHNATIYPIDSHAGFPFDYDSVVASARRNGQLPVIAAADAYSNAFIEKENALEHRGALIELLQFLNTPEALDANAGWYMYVNRIGNTEHDYAGANLVSYWYARNLHILANITHNVVPGDRVVVIIGQGHAAMLVPMLRRSPDLTFMDPEKYLH